MKLELFLNFDGNCREAVEFYAKVFKAEVGNVMTYGEAPPDPEYPTPEADKDRIIYAGVPIGGMTVMFSDVPSGSEYVSGSNISPTISSDDKNELTRIFDGLKDGGEVYMELQKTFFSEWFGMVEDKFGVIWQLSHYVQPE